MKTNHSWRFVAAFVLGIFVLGVCSAEAEIRVLDADDQYLGVLIDLSSVVTILIPSLNAVAYIDGENLILPTQFEPRFSTDDCGGTAHISSPWMYKVVVPLREYVDDVPFPPWGGFIGDNHYYVADPSNKAQFMAKSFYRQIDAQMGGCTQLTDEPVRDWFPLVEVQLPFNLPLALPLRLQHYPDNRFGLTDVVQGLQILSGLRGVD